jgi:energy-coupling factor transporter ATP-binding protein EcfA2
MIDIKNLSVRYAGQREWALREIDLHIEPGEFVLITGPSGCGKSTLARCLTGLIPQAQAAQLQGEIRVNGLDVTAYPVSRLAAHAGLVFQNPATQLFNLYVGEEAGFGPRNLGLPLEEVEERVAFALEATGIEHLRDRRIQSLSGGEQQRLAIASVLAMRPRLLVLDEPTSNLDWRGTEQVLNTLLHLNRSHGLTILVIEHRLHALAGLANRAILMHEGRIVLDGRPDQVLSDKALLARLGVRYPWHLIERGYREYLPDSIAPPPTDVAPLVTLQGVVAGYGRQMVLHDIDLALYPGQFAALVGDNGSGKSTLSRVLTGLLRPRQGRVIWTEGIRRLPAGRRAGVLFQNPLHQLLCDTVADEVAFGPKNFDIFSPQEVEAVLEAADLTPLRQRRPQAVSVGQQQRVALAATLSLAPRLLILDEPTIGQDWGHLSRFMDFLIHLNRNGQAILLITHDDKLICRYAERVILLHEGCIIADGRPSLPAQRSQWWPMPLVENFQASQHARLDTTRHENSPQRR